ncbi:drebrin isoform X4, partial [Silurus asotus]
GGLGEIMVTFDNSRIMYGFCSMKEPAAALPRYVLINWVGEDVPDARKCACASHVATIAEFFQGVDIIINASSMDDIDPSAIGQRLTNGTGPSASPVLSRLRMRDEENAEHVGTTYQKTNAEIEMKRINREEFWEQAKEEERKKLAEERQRFEEERMELERKEQEEREKRYREREKQIEEHRQALMERPFRFSIRLFMPFSPKNKLFCFCYRKKMQEDEEEKERSRSLALITEPSSEDLSQDKKESEVEEAAAIIAQRTSNPREFFKQREKAVTSSLDMSPISSHRTGKSTAEGKEDVGKRGGVKEIFLRLFFWWKIMNNRRIRNPRKSVFVCPVRPPLAPQGHLVGTGLRQVHQIRSTHASLPYSPSHSPPSTPLTQTPLSLTASLSEVYWLLRRNHMRLEKSGVPILLPTQFPGVSGFTGRLVAPLKDFHTCVFSRLCLCFSPESPERVPVQESEPVQADLPQAHPTELKSTSAEDTLLDMWESSPAPAAAPCPATQIHDLMGDVDSSSSLPQPLLSFDDVPDIPLCPSAEDAPSSLVDVSETHHMALSYQQASDSQELDEGQELLTNGDSLLKEGTQASEGYFSQSQEEDFAQSDECSAKVNPTPVFYNKPPEIDITCWDTDPVVDDDD